MMLGSGADTPRENIRQARVEREGRTALDCVNPATVSFVAAVLSRGVCAAFDSTESALAPLTEQAHHGQLTRQAMRCPSQTIRRLAVALVT
jgi:hypothetical protein